MITSIILHIFLAWNVVSSVDVHIVQDGILGGGKTGFCLNKRDGPYPDPMNCARYVFCENQKVTDLKACSVNTLFDFEAGKCLPKEQAKCYVHQGNTCYGAKSQAYGKFNTTTSGYIESIILKHISGNLSCARSVEWSSLWGCNRGGIWKDNGKFGTWITTNRNILKPVFPDSMVVSDVYMFYDLPGFDAQKSKSITMKLYKPFPVVKGDEMHVWYNEDLYNFGEGDNWGKHCIEVWVSYKHSKKYCY